MFGLIASMGLGMIKSHWKKFAGIGAVLLIALVIFFLHMENSHLQNKVAQQTAALKSFKQNEQQYKQRISDQNKSIDQLKAKADALKKKVEKSTQDINKIQNDFNKTINKLETQNAPTDCKGAMKYMLNHANQ